MQCHSCGWQIPEGTALCQRCGALIPPPPPSSLPPTVAASQSPYDNPASGASYNSPSIAPTVAASQPPYGNPGLGASYNPSSLPPTVAASQPPYGNPGLGASYNSSSITPTVAASQPPYGNPGPYTDYNPSSIAPTVAASQPPYGSPDPRANYNSSNIAPTVAASQPPYGNPGPYTDYNPSSLPGDAPGYGGAPNPYANVPYNPYGQPQPSNIPSYAPPPPNSAPAYAAGTPAFAGPVPGKPKRRVGRVFAIVIAILVIVIVGVVALASKSSPITAKGPSGNKIDSTASSIIKNIQMASAVDTNSYQPTKLATSFKKNAEIYATFQFDFNTADVNQQNPGYVQAKYYRQNTRVFTGDPLKVDDNVAPTGRGYGYFVAQYYTATSDGAVELYWCRQSNCSDAKLAQTTTFTVY